MLLTCNASEEDLDKWYLDSGCSDHMFEKDLVAHSDGISMWKVKFWEPDRSYWKR